MCAWNVAKNAGGVDAISCIVSEISRLIGDWHVVWLCEADGCHDLESEFEFDGHKVVLHRECRGGSRNGWLLNKSVARNACNYKWCERGGSFVLSLGGPRGKNSASDVLCVGLHGSLEKALLAQDLSQLHGVVSRKPFHRDVVILADWNVDLAPVHAKDPFKDTAGRRDRHAGRRALLYGFSNRHRLDISVARRCASFPEAINPDDWRGCPFTRNPQGLLQGIHNPSILSYALATRKCISKADAYWSSIVPTDHALYACTLRPRVNIVRKRRHVWHCVDENVALESLRSSVFVFPTDPAEALLLVREWQETHDDGLSCKARAEQCGWSEELGRLTQLLRCETDPARKRDLKHQCWRERQKISKARFQRKLICEIDRGKVVRRSKRLHRVESVLYESGNDYFPYDPHDAADAMKTYLEKQFGCNESASTAALQEFTAESGSVIKFSHEEVAVTFASLGHQTRIDLSGVCLLALHMFFLAHPAFILNLLSVLVSSSENMTNLEIHARCNGKTSPNTLLKDMRFIQPLSSIAQVLDHLLSTRLNRCLDELCHASLPLWAGGAKGTQCADVVSTCRLSIERMLDDRSRGGISAADIRKYYDNIEILPIARWLVEHGLDLGTISAIVRFVCLPRVSFTILGTTFAIGSRCTGVHTGSRLGGAIGRIPLIDVLAHESDKIKPFLWKAAGKPVPVLTWIDNIYVIGRTMQSALDCMFIIASSLSSRWNLHFKEGSKFALVPKNSDEVFQLPDGYVQTDDLECLGHVVSGDGNVAVCFAAAEKQAWGAFFANPASSKLKGAGLDRRLGQFTRCVTPCIAYRSSCWPPSKDLSTRLAKIQASMYATLLELPRNSNETIDSYMCRRGRAATALVRKHGSWSDQWHANARKWYQHLLRHPEGPAGQVLKFHDDDWLQVQRMNTHASRGCRSLNLSAFAGFTNTRKASGRPSQRFEQGIRWSLDFS